MPGEPVVNAGTELVSHASEFGPVVYVAIVSLILVTVLVIVFIIQSGRREDRILAVVSGNTSATAAIVPALAALTRDIQNHDTRVIEIQDTVDHIDSVVQEIKIGAMRIEERLKQSKPKVENTKEGWAL